jgi:hypothetical protein
MRIVIKLILLNCLIDTKKRVGHVSKRRWSTVHISLCQTYVFFLLQVNNFCTLNKAKHLFLHSLLSDISGSHGREYEDDFTVEQKGHKRNCWFEV